MKIRNIGDLQVSALGLGCMSMSVAYGPPADEGDMITAKAIPTKVRRGFVSGIASNKSQSISVPGNA